MARSRRRGLLAGWVAAALPLSGCATAIPPVEVTRFHAAAPAPSGTVAVEPLNPADAPNLEYRAYAAAVGQELQRLGFTEVTGAQSRYVARIDWQRSIIAAARRASPVSVGGGGAVGSYGSGVGLGVSVDLSPPPRPTVVFHLAVQLRARVAAPDAPALWEGRARTSAREGTPAAQPGLAAAKLARALFTGWPGKPGETISVK